MMNTISYLDIRKNKKKGKLTKKDIDEIARKVDSEVARKLGLK
jgi:hypothetical protein